MSGPEEHDWADEVMAVTLTFVRGLNLRQIAELLGFDPSSERTTMFGDADEQTDHGTGSYAVQVAEADGWAVVVEPNGYLTSLPGTVAALSVGGSAISVYWNVNALMRFTVARDGVVVRSFDPLLFDLGPEGEPLPEERGLTFGVDATVRQSALELAARLTGIRIDQPWLLATPRPTWTTRGAEGTESPARTID